MFINATQPKQQHKRLQSRGFSLIEVLIALFLFATGILGIAGLQMKSLSMLSNSDSINAAMLGVNDMVGRMRANNDGLKNNVYSAISLPTDSKPSCTTCSPAQDAMLEAYEVYARLEESLAEPALIITDSGNNIFTIEVNWLERIGLLSETKTHRISIRI